ncbi:MAG: hypothetical protein IKP53_08355 [Candidatus Methanomethylophilaceae archaeon]|nr:hypothetical protein [Candidatus Methanomethylophilaceae archaeon]
MDDLRRSGLRACRNPYPVPWAVAYDIEWAYCRAAAESAVGRLVRRGRLIRDGARVVRPYPGPDRECCYSVFSQVCSMDGPRYTEIRGPYPLTEYRSR